MNFIIRNGQVYRRVVALQAPKPQELEGPLRQAFEQERIQVTRDLQMLEKVFGFFKKHLKDNPETISARMRKLFSTQFAKSLLSDYSDQKMIEGWAEYPGEYGLSLVDLSNQLPPELGKLKKVQDKVVKRVGEMEKLAKDIPDPQVVRFVQLAKQYLEEITTPK